MAYQPISGSVVAFQGTPADLQVTASVSGTLQLSGTPSISGAVDVNNFPANQSVSGTVGTAQTGTVITSLVSTIPSSVIVGASIFGLPPVNITNTNLNVGGSVVAFQSNPSVFQALAGLMSTNASVITVGTAAANQSVSGTVGASVIGTVPTTQSGTTITSVVNIVPSSVLVGASLFGQLPAGTAVLGSVATLQGTNPWNIAGSVAAFVVGSSSIITVEKGSSILAVPVGSTITVAQGSVAAAVINTPQASVHGTVKIFPASTVSGHGSVNGAASVQVLAAPGAGLYNYVTDFTLSNTGAATTLVTFTDGDGSIMGRAIAPTAGGAVMAGIVSPMRTLQTNKVVNISAATATSVLYAWIGGYKAP